MYLHVLFITPLPLLFFIELYTMHTKAENATDLSTKKTDWHLPFPIFVNKNRVEAAFQQ